MHITYRLGTVGTTSRHSCDAYGIPFPPTSPSASPSSCASSCRLPSVGLPGPRSPGNLGAPPPHPRMILTDRARSLAHWCDGSAEQDQDAGHRGRDESHEEQQERLEGQNIKVSRQGGRVQSRRSGVRRSRVLITVLAISGQSGPVEPRNCTAESRSRQCRGSHSDSSRSAGGRRLN